MLVTVGNICGLWSCLGLFLLLKRLKDRRGSTGFRRACVARRGQQSNHRQTKSPSQPEEKQPPLPLMQSRLESADLEASDPTWNDRRCLSWATLSIKSFKESFHWSSGSAKQEASLSPSVCQNTFSSHPFTWIKWNHAVRAAGRDTFNGHKLKLG